VLTLNKTKLLINNESNIDLICDTISGTKNADLLNYLHQHGMNSAIAQQGNYNGETVVIANIRNHLSDVGHYVVLLGYKNGLPIYWDPYYGEVLTLNMNDWSNGDRTLIEWFIDTTIPISEIELPVSDNIEPVLIFLADAKSTLKPETDTTLDMERAANELCIPNRYATIQDCLIIEDMLLCNGIPIAQTDIVLIRLDPSLDGAYFDFLRTLCHVKANFINKPKDILTRNDKLLASTPLSIKIMSTNPFSIKKSIQIFKKHNIEQLVLKPISMFGGESIEFINREDPCLYDRCNFMVQKYGQLIIEPFICIDNDLSSTPIDVRVVIFNGEIVANADRVPPVGSLICNLSSGGSIAKRQLTEKEMQIAQTAIKILNDNQILFAGIDLLNGKLSEINISCPGALKNVSQAVGFDVSKKILSQLFKHY
jgi:glutathione synthase